MSPFYIEAFGGVKIDLPDDQIEDAKAFLTATSNDAITDFDPIPERGRGHIFKSILAAYVLVPGILLAVPILLYVVVIGGQGADMGTAVSLMGLFLFVLGIVFHARGRVRRLQ